MRSINASLYLRCKNTGVLFVEIHATHRRHVIDVVVLSEKRKWNGYEAIVIALKLISRLLSTELLIHIATKKNFCSGDLTIRPVDKRSDTETKTTYTI